MGFFVYKLGSKEGSGMEPNIETYMTGLMNFLKKELTKSPILPKLQDIIAKNLTSAGPEEDVFTSEFLCPAIFKYFDKVVRHSLNLTDEQIKKSLGREGNVPNFGFSPYRNANPHLFCKDDFFKQKPPAGWHIGYQGKLPPYRSSPDFAIKDPLPLRIMGEVKFISENSGKPIMEFYKAVREGIYYLSTFRFQYDRMLLARIWGQVL